MGPPAAEGQNHYFDAQPDVPSNRGSVRLVLPDLTFELTTDSGIFSGGGMDAGTKYLLLEAAQPPPDARTLLDLGCGYGPIALTLAARSPDAIVWAVDVNERALDLTSENADAAGLRNVRVGLPDDVPADLEFDAIVSNPPIRIGKQALHELLIQWLDRLRAGATATLVVQKHLGSDSLQRWLTAQGWPTERLGSRAGYRLLEVRSRVKNLSSTDLKRLHRDWRRRTEGRVALLLDGVQGPFNLGSILRTAAAYRVEHLWLAGTDTTPASEKVGKTALGSDRYVDWTVCDTAQDAVTAARSTGFDVVGVELADGAEPIQDAHLGDAVCLALGHEDRGLSQACLDGCDRVVYLPQLGRIGSLNVATAAALAIWEVRRRHWEPAPK